jgi:hypothetical protein
MGQMTVKVVEGTQGLRGNEYRRKGQRAMVATQGFRGGQMAVEETEGCIEDRGT